MQISREEIECRGETWIIETRDYIPGTDRLYQGEDTIPEQVTGYLEVNLLRKGLPMMTIKTSPESLEQSIDYIKFVCTHALPSNDIHEE